MENTGGLQMSDSVIIATPSMFLWRVASVMAPVFALLAFIMPLLTFVAAILVTLTLAWGFRACKSLLQQDQSRKITLWWLGLSVTSILALLCKWMLLAIPFPRYGDFLPPEPVSPLRQAILDNASVLYWGVGWAAVITTLAGTVILGGVFQKIRTTHGQAKIYASH